MMNTKPVFTTHNPHLWHLDTAGVDPITFTAISTLLESHCFSNSGAPIPVSNNSGARMDAEYDVVRRILRIHHLTPWYETISQSVTSLARS